MSANLHHNNPPGGIIDADDALAAARLIAGDLVPRKEELLAAYERWKEATSGQISDDILQTKSADFVKQLNAHMKVAEDSRKATKEPVLDLGRAVDAVFKTVSDPLHDAKTAVERAMTAYAQEHARKQQEAARKAAEEAQQRAREQAELAAMEAELMGEDVPPETPPMPEVTIPSNAEASRITSDYGVTASLRGRWTYEVVDSASVPRHLLMVNDAAVKAAIKAGERNVPGLRIFQETKIGIR